MHDWCQNCMIDGQSYKKHAWFCSQECATKWLKTLLVKTDTTIDPMDYKKKRGAIKRYPELQENIETELRSHLWKQLEGVIFNHTTSQKEDFIMD